MRTAIDDIRERLSLGQVLLLDGATGTELERRGAAMHDDAWCATATLTDPDLVRSVHEDYIRAGARVITANTFSTNRFMLEPAGLGGEFENINRRAVSIARQARERADAGPVAVAGSMSHQVPLEPGSDRRRPGSLPAEGVIGDRFREMAALLVDSGVDLLMMEMMSDPDLAVPAIEAAVATGVPVWVGFSVRGDADGALRSYSRPDLDAATLFDAVPLDGVEAAGIMHTRADRTGEAVGQLRRRWRGNLLAYPDSGHFKMPHWQFEDVIEPSDFAEYARQWRRRGVNILGGCCGLGVAHIEALARALRDPD